MKWTHLALAAVVLVFCITPFVRAEEDEEPVDLPIVDEEVDSGVNIEELKIQGEEHGFQAEVSRLMELIVRSLYSKREIFLREIISNAADALDRIRFMSLTDKDVVGDAPEFEIRIKADKENNALIIEDTGIGMTKQDLINNLGTIAHSGTQSFLDSVQTAGDLSAIGQFGVGFYSVFLVADVVDVHTKHNDDRQWMWQSTSEESYVIAEDDANDIARGTRIVLHLKEDAEEFLDDEKLIELAEHYSEFIQFPIYVHTSREIEVVDEVVEDVEIDDSEEIDEDDDLVPPEEEEEKEPSTHKETEWYWKHVNDQPAIWMRNPKEVEEEDYIRFYHAISEDEDDPYTYAHFKVEGEYEFRSILFVPSHHTANLIEEFEQPGLRLYVKRVLISDTMTELLPRWLNFLRGIVDSDDLPLNVSRETLQKSKVLRLMQRKLVQKALGMFGKLAKNDPAKFDSFMEQFGKFLKIGMIEDARSREKIAKLLRFKSTYTLNLEPSEDEEEEVLEYTSLKSYVERMPEDQEHIYYAVAESAENAMRLPFVESLFARGFEVLLFEDPLDEPALQNLRTFQDFELIPASSERVALSNEGPEFEAMEKFVKKVLGDAVEEVRVSEGLVSAPSALIHPEHAASANMERLIRQQQQLDPKFNPGYKPQRILLLNPNHPIVMGFAARIADLPEEKPEVTSEDFHLYHECEDIATLFLDSALLSSGYDVSDHNQLAERINTMLAMSLDVTDAEAPSFEEMKARFAEKRAAAKAEAEAAAAEEAAFEDGEDIEVDDMDATYEIPEPDFTNPIEEESTPVDYHDEL